MTDTEYNTIPDLGLKTTHYKLASELNKVAAGAWLRRHGDLPNSEPSSLLTHTSVIIAILTFFLPSNQNLSKPDYFVYMLDIETTFYLVVCNILSSWYFCNKY